MSVYWVFIVVLTRVITPLEVTSVGAMTVISYQPTNDTV